MFDFKWGIIPAASALFISVIMGIINDVAVSYIIIRAIIFAAVFFGVGFGLHFAINSFFPELLYNDDEISGDSPEEFTGTRVNITLDTGEYAVPELFKTPDNPHELGNIEDLVAGVFSARSSYGHSASFQKGIDDKTEAGYNNTGVLQDLTDIPSGSSSFERAPAEKPVFTPSFGVDTGMGGLPDLDMMASAFSSGSSPTPAAALFAAAPSAPPAESSMDPFMAAPVEEPETRKSSYKESKPTPLKGDFNPKELAEGIRAVLSKDK